MALLVEIRQGNLYEVLQAGSALQQLGVQVCNQESLLSLSVVAVQHLIAEFLVMYIVRIGAVINTVTLHVWFFLGVASGPV